MRLIEGLSIGIAAIRANKMRSLLTMLGIIIGIAAVLAMIAIGDGAKEIVIQDAQKMGGATRITLYQTSYKRGKITDGSASVAMNTWNTKMYWLLKQNAHLLSFSHVKTCGLARCPVSGTERH